MKELKEDVNKWRDSLHSQIGRLNIVKMLDSPKLIYKFVSPAKFQQYFPAQLSKCV